MKIRNGFVSNSSSSSFIVAFGRVDPDELEFFEQHTDEGYQLLTVKKALEENRWTFNYDPNKKKLSLDAPGAYAHWENVDLTDSIVMLEEYGDEGDWFFTDEDDDIDYDIDFQFFALSRDSTLRQAASAYTFLSDNEDKLLNFTEGFGAERMG
jgi:hypothetical protein